MSISSFLLCDLACRRQAGKQVTRTCRGRLLRRLARSDTTYGYLPSPGGDNIVEGTPKSPSALAVGSRRGVTGLESEDRGAGSQILVRPPVGAR